MTKALILAGGKGTRLGVLAKAVPKPMLKIGDKPVIEHQINLLRKYGIRDVVILVGYLPALIERYFGDGRRFGVKIDYFKEEKPLGTTGGIKAIEERLKEDFLVLYGDVMVNMDIERLLKFHKAKASTCALVVHPNDHPQDSDLVELNDNQKIVAFYSKPHPEDRYFKNFVNAGLYVMSPKILKWLEKGAAADFGKDIFPKIVNQESLWGYNTAEYLKDMGTPERLTAIREDYQSGKIERLNRANKRRAIFLDRDGTINKNVHLLHKIEDFNLFPFTSRAIKKINRSEFLAIVATNQPVVARNLCSIEEVEEIHKKMETLLGKEGAKLDAIYYCPHHPDKGYPEENPRYKINCDCRKPKLGLIKKAEEDFNIDVRNSYFIGDSFRDIICGRTAGMTTVGVKTGDKCEDGEEKPDYLFENLEKAVDFIIASSQPRL